MIRSLYVAAIGLSAFVFFSLQLLAGRLVLPAFGGSAGVWTTALAFFTAVLFVGYAYAHLVATRLGPRLGGGLHLALAGLALLGTLFGPTDAASLRAGGLPEAAAVIVALLALVGPPALLLSATTPLLSAWYARRSSDPWWLYAASNAASFTALFAYPLLIEPALPLSAQRGALVVGLALFVVLLGALVLASGRSRGRPLRPEPARAPAPEPRPAARLSVGRQLTWLAAAFVPAGLLSATTNFITTDLVSAPLLWVGPLAIYLASFVVAFSARGRRALGAVEWLVPAAATLLWLPFVLPVGWPALALLTVELGAFAVLAVALHGRLALDRPAESQLTRFYLILAAGGMLATAFVALVAPLAFPTIWEYPILLVAALALLVVMRRPGAAHPRVEPSGMRLLAGRLRDGARRLAPYAAVSAGVLLLVAAHSAAQALAIGALMVLGGIVILLASTPGLLAAATAGVVLLLSVAVGSAPLAQQRTFYGVIEVRQLADGRAMYHGTTLHGVQLASQPAEPTSYYGRAGPVGELVDDARSRGGALAIGVVGLGVGTLAAYAETGDRLVFFEIDQGVVDLALDERHFTFLADARATPEIVVADGRLALAEWPADAFDLLILDAFSSDSVPVHLLTREAIAEYARVVRPHGVIGFHLSNRYYELPPGVAATARSLGLAALVREHRPPADLEAGLAVKASTWLVVGEPSAVGRFSGAGWAAPGDGPLLTDDFPDVMRLLRLR